MKYEVVSKGYILIINREDGTCNDYRFQSKTELQRWMRQAKMAK